MPASTGAGWRQSTKAARAAGRRADMEDTSIGRGFRGAKSPRRRLHRRAPVKPRWRGFDAGGIPPALFLEVVGVDLGLVLLVGGDLVGRVDRVDRADGLAGAAVDADVGVDEVLLRVVVRLDAVDRALLDAGLVLHVEAGVGDHVGHDALSVRGLGPRGESRSTIQAQVQRAGGAPALGRHYARKMQSLGRLRQEAPWAGGSPTAGLAPPATPAGTSTNFPPGWLSPRRRKASPASAQPKRRATTGVSLPSSTIPASARRPSASAFAMQRTTRRLSGRDARTIPAMCPSGPNQGLLRGPPTRSSFPWGVRARRHSDHDRPPAMSTIRS